MDGNLILSRKKNEKIVIHQDGQVVATIYVAELRGDKVRLGVHADPTIKVDREEVYNAKLRDPEAKPEKKIETS